MSVQKKKDQTFQIMHEVTQTLFQTSNEVFIIKVVIF